MKKGIIVILIVGITISICKVNAFLYTASNVTYSHIKLTSSNIQKTIEELYNNACPSNAVCIWKKKWTKVEVGDYVKMTPSKTSYNVDLTKTGMTEYSGTNTTYLNIKNNGQTIYPRELKLWRVIRKNEDGTIDLVSEYTSSINIYFHGTVGYANYIGYLNTLASQYENSNFTTSSRYMGYNGQAEIITDTSAFDGTIDGRPNLAGLPDILYTTDSNLVKTAYIEQEINPLIAKKCNDNNCSNPTIASDYWLASRGVTYGYGTWMTGRYVQSTGSISSSDIRGYYSDSGWVDYTNGFSLRPIVTLKSGLIVDNAFGTKENPFVLE